MGASSFTQVTFRLRNDNGSESAATWRQTQGTDDTIDVTTNFRCRFLIDETSSKAWTNISWNLYYSLNGGAYTAVSGTTPVQFALSSYFADHDDCTSQLTGGSGTFVTNNNGMAEAATVINSGSAGYFFETEWCLTLDSAQLSDGDTIALRIYNGTSAIAAYTDTPLITVNVPTVTHEGEASLNGTSSLTVAGTVAELHEGGASLSGTSSLICTIPVTYYVDATTGSDSYDGLTEGTAWQTVSKVNSASLNPGDTVKFKRGETFTGPLVPVLSGNSDRYITYSDYGTGTIPYIDGSASYALWITNSYHYLKYENIGFLYSTGASVPVARCNTSYVEFTNCLFGYSTSYHGFVAYSSTDGSDVHHITLTGCQATSNNKTGFYCSSATGASGPHDILFQDCVADNNGTVSNSDHGFYVAFGVVLDGCTASFNYSAGIKVNSNGQAGSPYAPIVRNCFSTYNNEDGIYIGHYDALFYNNQVYYNERYNWNFDAEGDNCEFYFNIFLNCTSSSTRAGDIDASLSTGNIFKNNIFIQDSSVITYGIMYVTGSLANLVANNTFDYNVYYYDGSGSSTTIMVTSVDGARTFAQVQAAGAEAHGTALSSSPGLLEMTSGDEDLRPIQGGNIDVFEALTISGITTDFLGITRREPTNPGPYEVVVINAAASLTGTSSLTVAWSSGATTHEGQSSLSGTSSLTGVGSVTHVTNEGEASLSGTSSLTIVGTLTHATWEGESSLSGTSSLTVVGTLVHATWEGTVSLEGTSSLSVVATSSTTHEGESSLSGSSTLTVGGTVVHATHEGASLLSAQSGLIPLAKVIWSANSSLSGTSSLSIIGTVVHAIHEAVSSLQGTSSLVGVGSVVHATIEGAASITGTSVLISAGSISHAIWLGESSLSGTSSLFATASVSHAIHLAEASLSATSVLTVAGSVTHSTWEGICSLSGTSEMTISVAGSIDIQNAAHLQSAESVSLTQHHTLVSQDSSHLQSAGSLDLVQHGTLVPSSCTHLLSSESPDLLHNPLLTVENCSQSMSSETPTLTQHFVLTSVQDAQHLQTSESPSLTQHYVLSISDASQLQSVDNVDLTQHYVLPDVDDSSHLHGADNVDLVVTGLLTIQDALQGHTAGNLDLAANYDLTVQDSSQLQSSGNVGLTQHNILVSNPSSHLQTSENADLIQHGTLSVQNASHLQSADNVTLSASIELIVGSSQHLSTSQTPTLVFRVILSPDNSSHLSTSDLISLEQHYIISIEDSLIGIWSSNIQLEGPGIENAKQLPLIGVGR